MYVTKYKDKYRAFERYKVAGQWRKVSVTMDRDTPQARSKAAAALAEKMRSPSSGLTYPQLVDAYIKYQKKVCRPSTWTRNEATLKRLIRVFGNAKVNAMTSGYISESLLEISEKPGTFNEYLKRVKALFRWAYEKDYIKSAECVNKITVLSDPGKLDKLAEKFLDVDELAAVLAGASDYNRPIFEFLALSGLRIGELIALDDIDVTENEIIITKTYDSNNAVLNSPKTESSFRRVHIQAELKESIRKIRLNSRIYSMRGGFRSPYFAVNPYGGRLSYVNTESEFKRLCVRVIGRPLTLHSLRHTHVALMAQEGVTLDAISRRLGHKSSRVTRDIYFHVTKKQRQKDNAEFDAVNIFGTFSARAKPV